MSLRVSSGWTWWTNLQPTWRTVHIHTKLNAAPQNHNDQGDWTNLDCLGQNGFLSVIVCLKW
ncbi:hypothetical protein BV22DRAFT_1025300 [Leucogyrophana mollusca]|uniref:Uncharacterized protein n=1 Tax=Leucogyrophana mollusca TaxID=85980 RepID=A0ACB8AXJ9_9AGAM|nr:hypothetical protein BV22DRAFT_1025300 [Leucogyrophana mollusca]